MTHIRKTFAELAREVGKSSNFKLEDFLASLGRAPRVRRGGAVRGIAVFGIGVFVGGVSALLLSPLSGKQLRQKIVDRVSDLTNQAQGRLQGFRERLTRTRNVQPEQFRPS